MRDCLPPWRVTRGKVGESGRAHDARLLTPDRQSDDELASSAMTQTSAMTAFRGLVPSSRVLDDAEWGLSRHAAGSTRAECAITRGLSATARVAPAVRWPSSLVDGSRHGGAAIGFATEVQRRPRTPAQQAHQPPNAEIRPGTTGLRPWRRQGGLHARMRFGRQPLRRSPRARHAHAPTIARLSPAERGPNPRRRQPSSGPSRGGRTPPPPRPRSSGSRRRRAVRRGPLESRGVRQVGPRTARAPSVHGGAHPSRAPARGSPRQAARAQRRSGCCSGTA